MTRNFWVGEKITLRAVAINDIDGFFKTGFNSDDLDRFCDEINFQQSNVQMKERLEKVIRKEAGGDEFWWIIEDTNGHPVGNINTFSCNKRVGVFKYGLGLKKEYWDKGYAEETIKIVLRYFFRELRYQKVNTFIYSFNEQSIKLHESLGFKMEGRLRRVVYTNGEFFDEIYFGMTSEEFELLDPKVNVCE